MDSNNKVRFLNAAVSKGVNDSFLVQCGGGSDPRVAGARLVGGGRLRHVRHPALRGRVGRAHPRRRRPARHLRQAAGLHRVPIGLQLLYPVYDEFN